jgi:hypothetical protein
MPAQRPLPAAGETERTVSESAGTDRQPAAFAYRIKREVIKSIFCFRTLRHIFSALSL